MFLQDEILKSIVFRSGTTYMAACGLEANRRDSMRSSESEESFNDNVVKVMAQFAVEMMAVLSKLNGRSFYRTKPYKCVLYLYGIHIFLKLKSFRKINSSD